MRALLKQTNSVCLHKAQKNSSLLMLSKNHVLNHFGASALPGDRQGLGTHGLPNGLLRCLSVWLVLCFSENANISRIQGQQSCRMDVPLQEYQKKKKKKKV